MKIMTKSTKCVLCSISITAKIVFCTFAQAEGLSEKIESRLDTSDKSSQHFTFTWDMTENTSDVPMNRRAIAPGRLASDGVRPRTAQETFELEKLIAGRKSHNTATAIVERNAELTRVYLSNYVGTPNRISDAVEYFDNGYGLMYTTDVQVPKQIEPSAFVWKAPANAIYYRSTFQEGLNMAPEELVFLAHANALKMYGCDWRVVSSTASKTVLFSEVKRGNFSPFSIRITLDGLHDNAVSRLEMVSPHSTNWCDISGFRSFQGHWIGTRVELYHQLPRITTRRRVYTLRKVSPSKSFALTIPVGTTVNDYRLHGAYMTTGNFFDTGKNGDTKSQFYGWSGSLPSEDSFKRASSAPSPVENHANLYWYYYVVGGLSIICGGLLYIRAKKPV